MERYALGADIGGSHISCALVDILEGKLISNTFSEGDVDNKADAETILKAWTEVLNRSLGEVTQSEFAGIGFGMPGPFDYHTGIARFSQVEKYYSLNGVDVARMLQQKIITDKPLRFMNDASAFAVGEAWLGAASGTIKSVSITLGTGFGSAFVAEGIPVVNGETVPQMGCVWHLPYKDGIADDYFSTRWFVKRWLELTGLEAKGVKEIAQATSESKQARLLFEEYGSNMGEFFAPWLQKFEAEKLVIGGNVAAAYQLFGPAFEQALQSKGVQTTIAISTLKDQAAIIGSARLLDPSYWQKIKPILPMM